MPKKCILVTFTYQGKEYKGKISEVSGAGAYMWELYIHKNDGWYYQMQIFIAKRLTNQASPLTFQSQ